MRIIPSDIFPQEFLVMCSHMVTERRNIAGLSSSFYKISFVPSLGIDLSYFAALS